MSDNSSQTKYSIKRKLGAGAMGEVFLARDNDLHRDVAVKRLHFTTELAAKMTEEQQQEARDRFIQEARSVAHLNHPNIITIYQIVTNAEHSYIVMEYLNGKTLQSWLNDMHHFSVATVINIGMQVAAALDYAHRAGIVHRDIKPDNIFLTSNTDKPDEITVKINDFGVARMEDGSLVETKIGAFIGTPAYISPEQARGEATIDGRSDLYSLAIMLYHLLTRQFPYKANNLSALLTKIQLEEPTPASKYNPELPIILVDIIAKSLAKDAKNRFQTGKQMQEELQKIELPPEDLATLVETHLWSSTAAIIVDKPSPDMDAPFAMVLDEMNFSDPIWITRLFSQCDRRTLKIDNLENLLEQLLNAPLYADPFSGSVHFGSHCLLVWHGLLLQVIDMDTGEFGETVFAKLPYLYDGNINCELLTAKDSLCQHMPLLINTIITESAVLHSDLDSGMIDMGGLISKLVADHFSGVVRMRHDNGVTLFCFYNGVRVFALQDGSNMPLATQANLADLTIMISASKFKADLFSCVLQPLQEGLRHLFGKRSCNVTWNADVTSLQSLLKMRKSKLVADLTKQLHHALQLEMREVMPNNIVLGSQEQSMDNLWVQSKPYIFIRWLLTNGLINMLKTGNRDHLKYIATWIPNIAIVKFNHSLLDDDGQQYRFDIICEDANAKVLLLLQTGNACDELDLENFLHKVTTAKQHLIKSGDIGGALYLSSTPISNDARIYYQSRTEAKKSQFGLGYLDAITGFKGFVRMGKNRGFHCCLLQTDNDNHEDISFIEPEM
ncbi:MAG: serine/threonine-protein kinase [Mariprofundales bacterium]